MTRRPQGLFFVSWSRQFSLANKMQLHYYKQNIYFSICFCRSCLSLSSFLSISASFSFLFCSCSFSMRRCSSCSRFSFSSFSLFIRSSSSRSETNQCFCRKKNQATMLQNTNQIKKIVTRDCGLRIHGKGGLNQTLSESVEHGSGAFTVNGRKMAT